MRLFGARSTAEAKRASGRAHRPELAPKRGFELTISAFALAGVAMIGALFALKGGDENVATSGSSGATLLKDSTQPAHVGVVRSEEQSIDLAQAPPDDVSPPGAFAPAAAAPQADPPAAAEPQAAPQVAADPLTENVATSGSSGATLLKDSTQPAHVGVVRSEEQSIDLAQAPPDDVSPPGAFAPAAAGAAQPRPGSPAAATVNTPVAAPPPTASQFPDPETVRAAASLGPDGTPIATRPASGADSGEAAQANDAAKPPAKPAPEAASETGQPRQLRAPAKPKKAARAAPKAPPAAAEPQAAPQVAPPQAAPRVAADPLTAPPVPHTPPQEPANPLARAFGELGALAAPATSTRQPVESTPATSSGWAVQLAASKSETEAKSDAARLNARYASALNGAAISVHKARANVATGYRLRVVGLSKADAAALCARLKGHGADCFILKSVTTLISTSP